MATYKPVLHKYTKEDGTNLIQIRITKFQTSVKLGTGYYIKKKDWNVKGFVRSTDSLFEKYNRSLAALIKELQDIEITANMEGNSLNAVEIKEAYQGKRLLQIIPLYQEYIDTCKAKDITKDNYRSSLLRFKEFLGSNASILVRNITFDLVQKYEQFMLSNGNGQGTANQYLGIFSSVMKFAVVKGIIPLHKNPFATYKIAASKSSSVFIPLDEIIKLATAALKDKEGLYRDIYMTQFLGAGMRVRDAFFLKKVNIVGAWERLEYTMSKNNKDVSVPICDTLKSILTRWISTDRDYIFPILNHKKDPEKQVNNKINVMNANLKKIAQKIGINPEINTHSARHSFGEIAEKRTKDPKGLQHVYKHSNIETTMRYIDKNQSVDEYDYIINSVLVEFDKVGQLLNSDKK